MNIELFNKHYTQLMVDILNDYGNSLVGQIKIAVEGKDYTLIKEASHKAELLSKIRMICDTYMGIAHNQGQPKQISAELTAIEFRCAALKGANMLLSDDYKTGFKEGVEKYIESIQETKS